jgi:hypothetical protein
LGRPNLHLARHEGVEVAFDTLENTLDFDKVYVQSREGVYGYFFITFNSLLLYFKTMSMLREAGMLKRSRSRTCSSSSPRSSSSTSVTKGSSPKSRNSRGFSATLV